MASLAPVTRFRFFTAGSVTSPVMPLVFGKVYTYEAGTTTPKVTFTNAGETSGDQNTNPIILDARGEADIWLGAGTYKMIVTDALGVQQGGPVDGIKSMAQVELELGAVVGVLRADLASTTVGKGAAMIGWLRGLAGAVATTVYRWMHWRDPCIFEWMTTAQVTDYQARTAVANFAGALDLTAPIQAAINASYASGQRLYCPPGAAKTTGIKAPPTAALYEDRGDAWCMYGGGAPQPFVRFPSGGTLLISETDAPVFKYQQQRTMPTAGGNLYVRGIRFEQRNVAATSPVVLWDSMSEDAEFSNNSMLQFGLGDAFKVTYQIKGNVERNFAMCGGYFSSTRSAAGIGFNIPSTADAGLLLLRKNTARCFFWGYVHGDGVNDSSGALFDQNEASDCTNGLWNKAACTAATIRKMYTEGITGTCIKDEGTMTTIAEGMHYLGFTVGIDASSTINYGTRIEGNYLETAGPGCTLIKLGSGGGNKTVRGNHLLFSTSGGTVANVIGIEITGLEARFDVSANAFLPRGAWIGGAGTIKMLNSSTGGVVGFLPLADGADLEIPTLMRGAVTFQANANAIVAANIVANVFPLPATNVVNVNATSAATVSSLSQAAELNGGHRVVHIVTANNNVTFNDSATILLNGVFTGSASGGMLTLLVNYDGALLYGREVARTSF